jgi:hypothetical protein
VMVSKPAAKVNESNACSIFIKPWLVIAFSLLAWKAIS